MTPEQRDLPKDGCEGKHRQEAFWGGFELDETLLVHGWEDYVPDAEVTFRNLFFHGRSLRRMNVDTAVRDTT